MGAPKESPEVGGLPLPGERASQATLGPSQRVQEPRRPDTTRPLKNDHDAIPHAGPLSLMLNV
eukprot:5520362-Pyramimonas_sp.AAC.1